MGADGPVNPRNAMKGAAAQRRTRADKFFGAQRPRGARAAGGEKTWPATVSSGDGPAHRSTPQAGESARKAQRRQALQRGSSPPPQRRGKGRRMPERHPRGRPPARCSGRQPVRVRGGDQSVTEGAWCNGRGDSGGCVSLRLAAPEFGFSSVVNHDARPCGRGRVMSSGTRPTDGCRAIPARQCKRRFAVLPSIASKPGG